MRETQSSYRAIAMAVSLVALLSILNQDIAVAQCAFNGPANARKLSMTMVRAYPSCEMPDADFDDGCERLCFLTHPNACAAPAPVSLYQFDTAKGRCAVSFKAKRYDVCFYNAEPCSETLVMLKCGDLLDPFSQPVTGPGWRLHVVFRQTMHEEQGFGGRDPADMTMIDFDMWFYLPEASSGALKARMSSLDWNADMFGLGYHPAIAKACMNVEILGVRLVDPDGNTFAVPGIGVR